MTDRVDYLICAAIVSSFGYVVGSEMASGEQPLKISFKCN